MMIELEGEGEEGEKTKERDVKRCADDYIVTTRDRKSVV